MSKRKPYNNCAGYVASRHNIVNGGWIVIYRATDAGVDVGDTYAVVCELHHVMVGVPSIPKARPLLKVPDFCEECMREAWKIKVEMGSYHDYLRSERKDGIIPLTYEEWHKAKSEVKL